MTAGGRARLPAGEVVGWLNNFGGFWKGTKRTACKKDGTLPAYMTNLEM